jgi:hypothetical protein
VATTTQSAPVTAETATTSVTTTAGRSISENSASIDDLTGGPSGLLDQYTIHPFVFLHPVIKPPLAEYTSITDCIDTSTIERPVSPNILGILFRLPYFHSNHSIYCF